MLLNTQKRPFAVGPVEDDGMLFGRIYSEGKRRGDAK